MVVLGKESVMGPGPTSLEKRELRIEETFFFPF